MQRAGRQVERPEGARGAYGERHAAAKLTERAVRDIRKQVRQGRVTMAALAETYGVTPPTVMTAAYGRTWAHVPGALTETVRERARPARARTTSHEGQTTTRLAPSLLQALEKRRQAPTEAFAEVIDRALLEVRRKREPRLRTGLLAVSTWPMRDPAPRRGRPHKRDTAVGRITWISKRAARILDREKHDASERRTDVLARLLRER